MVKKLEELYEKTSLHKSLWSRAKEGLERVKARHDAGFKKFQQIKQAPGPIPHPIDPNLGQKDVEKPKKGNDWGKAALGAAVGGIAAGPIGAASLGVLWGMKKKK